MENGVLMIPDCENLSSCSRPLLDPKHVKLGIVEAWDIAVVACGCRLCL